jgi:hypothetical protein
MEISRASLEERYAAFSDRALLEAAAAGPESYSPLAWSVIQELVAARRLHADLAGVPAEPTPPVVTDAFSSDVAISPYLFLSRFRGQTWPHDRPLRLAGRDALGAIAVLAGGGGLLFFLYVVMFTTGALPDPLSIVALGAGAVVSLAFALSANRTPSPRTWRMAMAYCCLGPALTIFRMARGDSLDWPRGALSVAAGLLWALYFARRRPMYGLAAWPSVRFPN